MARRGDGIYQRSRTWWFDFTREGTRHLGLFVVGLLLPLSRRPASHDSRDLRCPKPFESPRGHHSTGPPRLNASDEETRISARRRLGARPPVASGLEEQDRRHRARDRCGDVGLERLDSRHLGGEIHRRLRVRDHLHDLKGQGWVCLDRALEPSRLVLSEEVVGVHHHDALGTHAGLAEDLGHVTDSGAPEGRQAGEVAVHVRTDAPATRWRTRRRPRQGRRGPAALAARAARTCTRPCSRGGAQHRPRRGRSGEDRAWLARDGRRCS